MGLFKVKCPKCGQTVPKGSKFCGRCGYKMESGNPQIRCPSCGTQLPAESRFCPKCGVKLDGNSGKAPEREFDKNRRWVRRPGDFAQRFEVPDLKGVFAKSITIEQGTRALLLQGGVFKGFLDAGYYTLGNGMLSRLSVSFEEKTTVILVDAGEVPVSFTIPETELRAKNGVRIGVSGCYTVQIQQPVVFLENYLKSTPYLSIADLNTRFSYSIKTVAAETMQTFTADELIRNPEAAHTLEQNLMKDLNGRITGTGMKIMRVTGIRFDEGAWESVENIRAEKEIQTGKAQAEFAAKQKYRAYETADTVNSIENSGAVAHAKQDVSHSLKDSELDFTIHQDQKQFEHEQKKIRHEFDEDLYEVRSLRNMQHDSRRTELEIERENERMTLENRSNASVEALISVLGGDNPAAKEIAKLELSKRAASLTPEQLLAVQAAESPEAAKALGNKYRAEEQKEFNQRTEEMYRENAANMKEVMNTALNAMGSTATARATAQNPGTTVVAGGMGSAVIAPSGKRCPDCGTVNEETDMFCSNCGRKF